jgi:hypothetical protein
MRTGWQYAAFFTGAFQYTGYAWAILLPIR